MCIKRGGGEGWRQVRISEEEEERGKAIKGGRHIRTRRNEDDWQIASDNA